jgi:hypothetical protein
VCLAEDGGTFTGHHIGRRSTHGPGQNSEEYGRISWRVVFADEEFFSPLIAQLPSGSPGSRWLIRPGRGPRLVLVHRPEGVMGYTHSHRCWVGIAPVLGVETHQRWDAVRQAGGRAELRLADERALVRGDAATLVPPRDVHNHGHVPGSGPSPYSLILLGDDMLLFDREEYDPERGTWRALAPGDPGRDNR